MSKLVKIDLPKVKAAMKEKDAKINWVAEFVMDCAYSTLQRWLAGKRTRLNRNQAQALYDYLGIADELQPADKPASRWHRRELSRKPKPAVSFEPESSNRRRLKQPLPPLGARNASRPQVERAV